MLIYDFTLEALQSDLKSWGEPDYRATQLWQGLYKHLYDTPNQFTTLPLHLRKKIEERFTFHSFESLIHVNSEDGETEKVLLRSDDDQRIETVLMYYDKRRTVCLSTQAGCAMGCVFCATGQMGFHGNLSRGQIVEQVLYYARKLSQRDDQVSNIVTMGMGEPFHNYDATMDALDILNHPDGFNFGARRMTVSTVGVIPMIERFTREGRRVNLAVSLHAATNELRDQLVPINRKYPLESLLRACNEYVSLSGRRISFEWALIDGVNDSLEQAQKCSDLLKGLVCHVNLIPLNPTDGYAPSGASQVTATTFRHFLQSHGIPTTIRLRRGIDIHAGCGQLAGLNWK
ncbi:MAG: 23S rRNA (adenine(2503)-C(2))-methyltransferase [Chloroflexi bacterium RBG_16_48_8]|nr:MAG: 23S rRNA (adenine(2503)-C(2))-methyltransferase [Chloroflexi bacterium RBG_16_48_8]